MDLGLSVGLTNIASILSGGGVPVAPLMTSIVPFSITLSTSATTFTDSIASTVDKSRSSFFGIGAVDGDGQDDFDRGMFRLEFVDDDNIKIDRVVGQNPITASGYIANWNPVFVDAVQHLTTTMTSASNAVSTPSINANLIDCVAVYCGNDTTEIGDNVHSSWATAEKTGSNGAVTITVKHRDSADTLIVSHQLIQFVPGVLNQNQQVEIIMINAGEVTETAALSSTDLTKTLGFYNGLRGFNAGANIDAASCFGELESTTVARSTRDRNANDTAQIMTFVEFTDAVLKSVERRTDTFGAAETTDPLTLSTPLTDQSLAFINKMGWNITTAVDWEARVMQNASTIIDENNVDNLRAAATDNDLKLSIEIYQT